MSGSQTRPATKDELQCCLNECNDRVNRYANQHSDLVRKWVLLPPQTAHSPQLPFEGRGLCKVTLSPGAGSPVRDSIIQIRSDLHAIAGYLHQNDAPRAEYELVCNKQNLDGLEEYLKQIEDAFLAQQAVADQMHGLEKRLRKLDSAVGSCYKQFNTIRARYAVLVQRPPPAAGRLRRHHLQVCDAEFAASQPTQYAQLVSSIDQSNKLLQLSKTRFDVTRTANELTKAEKHAQDLETYILELQIAVDAYQRAQISSRMAAQPGTRPAGAPNPGQPWTWTQPAHPPMPQEPHWGAGKEVIEKLEQKTQSDPLVKTPSWKDFKSAEPHLPSQPSGQWEAGSMVPCGPWAPELYRRDSAAWKPQASRKSKP